MPQRGLNINETIIVDGNPADMQDYLTAFCTSSQINCSRVMEMLGLEQA